ncbi:hypothetical protein [Actinopolymorpha sp. B9G3]|uniref:hypothetical protein n=1 Tax=Actinopolymorpha sp. B9G3 TaxID=3158970 RepID=UPI0032D8CF92
MEAWRGRVNAVTDEIDLLRPVDADVVADVAAALIAQRLFPHPTQVYYDAVCDALTSGERLAREANEDEHVMRDYLTRLRDTLADKRPWPDPAYRVLDPTSWKDHSAGRPIARIALLKRKVSAKLNGFFETVPGEKRGVMLVRLKTGDTFALQAPEDFREPGVTLLADTDDPASLIARFCEHTGFSTDDVVALER